ncbi:MAG: Hsp20/alpha crystallin family protein [Candidatus Micrarchaeota archaeon]|nr:Hsp20/alpha crystallin family protein [Candidatus Micrarchaeota archaeon]
MVKRRRPFGFGDFFSDFGDLNDMIRDMFENMGGMRLPERFREGEPIVYGVNVRIGHDGKPVVSQFGNVEKGKVKEEREPLVDIIEEKEDLRVIIELPGVEKHEIKLDVSSGQLAVEVTNPERRFAKTIPLPAQVDEKTAKATCKNGILEIVLKRAEPLKERPGAKIKVE